MSIQNGGSKRSFWDSGLEKITYLMHGKNVKVDPKASKIISDNLSGIFTSVIGSLKEKNSVNASVGIKKLLPPKMADYAMAEGFKVILLWNTMPFDFLVEKKLDEKYAKLLEKMKIEDEAELKRSYMSALKEVVKSTYTDARLDKKSSLYICHILDNLSNEMVKKLNIKNINKLTLDEAHNVAKDILPKELLQHASAEGNKMLYKFEGRGLQFMPGASAHQRVQEIMSPTGEEAKELITNGTEFKSGVTPILKQTHSGFTFSPSGKRIICRNLDMICNRILQKSGAEGTTKTQEDIQKAMLSVFPPLMAEHAVVEANRLIRRLENGNLEDLSVRSKKEKMTFERYKRNNFNFKDGILAITKTTYPEGTLDQSALNYIATNLDALLSALTKKVKDSGVKNVTSDDIKKAVSVIIASDTLNAHANMEGDKMVTLHKMGHIMFPPKR